MGTNRISNGRNLITITLEFLYETFFIYQTFDAIPIDRVLFSFLGICLSIGSSKDETLPIS